MHKINLNFLIIFFISILLITMVPNSSFSYSNKAKNWINNGKKHMKNKQYRDAVYCFQMAKFYEKENKELEMLLKDSSKLLNRRGPSLYLIPKEPFKFNYILFKERKEDIADVKIKKGSTIFKDGSSITLSTYLKKLKKVRPKRKGYWGDRKTILSQGRTDEKIIALTYDDGPNPKYTPKLMKILNKYNVKATFFVIGKNAKKNKDIIKKLAASGHLIANHSWSHKNMARLGNKSLDKELDKNDKVIEGAGLKVSTFFRPPYGAMSKRLIKKIKEKNKHIVLWSIDTRDWQHPSASTILKRIFNTVRPGDVILMHDIHPQALYVTESIIKVMKKSGYRFVLLDELYNIKTSKKSPQSGNFSDISDKISLIDSEMSSDMIINSKQIETVNIGVKN